MTEVDRLRKAAVEFARQNRIVRAMWMELKIHPCEHRERPDYECGDNGVPECKFSDSPQEEWCDRCKRMAANKPAWKEAIRKRASAKRRMIRWAEKIESCVGFAGKNA